MWHFYPKSQNAKQLHFGNDLFCIRSSSQVRTKIIEYHFVHDILNWRFWPTIFFYPNLKALNNYRLASSRIGFSTFCSRETTADDSLSPQNQKQSDLSHLGNLSQSFWWKNMGRGSHRRPMGKGWSGCTWKQIKIAILKNVLLVLFWNLLRILEMSISSYKRNSGVLNILGEIFNFDLCFTRNWLFGGLAMFMMSIWRHTLDVCTYFNIYI